MLRKSTYNLSRVAIKVRKAALEIIGRFADLIPDEQFGSEVQNRLIGVDIEIDEAVKKHTDLNQTSIKKLKSILSKIDFFRRTLPHNADLLNRAIDLFIPTTSMIESFFTNTMVYKLTGLALCSYIATTTSGLTSLAALSGHAIAIVGAIYLAAQLLRSHLQATVESYTPPVSSGFMRKCFEAVKAFTFSAWFTAYDNAQLVLKDDAPTKMTLIQHLNHLTIASSNEVSNWINKIRLATPVTGLGLIAASTLAGMPLNLLVVGAIIATGVLCDLTLTSTWEKQTLGFLLPAARSLRLPSYRNNKRGELIEQPNPLFSHQPNEVIKKNGEAHLGKARFDLYRVTFLNNQGDDDTFKHFTVLRQSRNDTFNHQYRAIGRNGQGRFGDIGIRRGTPSSKTQEEVNAFWFSPVEPTRTSWQ